MAARTIRIVYPCGNTPGLGLRESADYVRWLEGVRQKFASLGWRVTAQSPTMSATNVDEDELCLESDGSPLPRSVLESVLSQIGIAPLYWHGDVDDAV